MRTEDRLFREEEDRFLECCRWIGGFVEEVEL